MRRAALASSEYLKEDITNAQESSCRRRRRMAWHRLGGAAGLRPGQRRVRKAGQLREREGREGAVDVRADRGKLGDREGRRQERAVHRRPRMEARATGGRAGRQGARAVRRAQRRVHRKHQGVRLLPDRRLQGTRQLRERRDLGALPDDRRHARPLRRNSVQRQAERRLPHGSVQRHRRQRRAMDVQQRRPEVREARAGARAARAGHAGTRSRSASMAPPLQAYLDGKLDAWTTR